MRLPLFVVTKPVIGLKSPNVLFPAGIWKVSNDSDCVFSLNGEVRSEISSAERFLVSAEILSVGKSPSLTVYLDNGTD